MTCLCKAGFDFEKQKQPYYITRADGKPMAMAGLWDRWTGEDRDTLESFTILTIAANETMRPVHDRMPCILESEVLMPWLDPAITNVDEVQVMLVPAAAVSWRCAR
ncbi:MAG: SOS response-associated peptidase family protein [Phycisphaeraceae bacterium]|nr:SOS response-associated peptidase family protein [Phycisphaeraceae bacterium]